MLIVVDDDRVHCVQVLLENGCSVYENCSHLKRSQSIAGSREAACGSLGDALTLSGFASSESASQSNF